MMRSRLDWQARWWASGLWVLCGLAWTSSGFVVTASAESSVSERPGVGAESGVIVVPLGVTRADRPILARVPREPAELADPTKRLVIVAGWDGADRGVRAAEAFERAARKRLAERGWLVSSVPLLRPDLAATDAPAPKASQPEPLTFPPPEDGYRSPTVVEAQYLWRWLTIEGFDAVIEIHAGDQTRWSGPGTGNEPPAGGLSAALPSADVGGVGGLPGWRLEIGPETDAAGFEWEGLVDAWLAVAPNEPSAARQTLRSRVARTPRRVAIELAEHYGHTLRPVEYLQGTAVLGRLRLARLLDDAAMEADVRRIASEWLGKRTVDVGSSGSVFAGHLVFAELARTGGDPGFIDLVRQVGDRGFDASGQPLEVMPSHTEMSDAVFMSTPMLVEAGVLTGEAKYFEMAGRHLRYMLKLNLRVDGLHRHSPLDETAWGRGNGFPALGLAMCLDQIPESRPERAEMLSAFRAHVAALLPHQDASGMWHQIIDGPESYRELTATCMITYALLRGVQQGWLDAETYSPAIRRAWDGLKRRIGEDGVLTDVCTGTGKQPSRRDYYDRQAIVGKDNRGGAMALLVATEYARWSDRLAAEAVGQRVPWDGSRLVGSPDPPPPFSLRNAFPGLEFDRPVSVHAMPNLPGAKPNRMVVLQEDGKIFTFLADELARGGATAAGELPAGVELLADFSATPPPLSGHGPEDSNRISVYSLAFHPEFERNRQVVICYLVSRGARRPEGTHIASFELRAGEPPELVLESERTIFLFDSGGHNGCTVAFGNDGMLYISTGDVASPSPPDKFDHGQNVGDVYSAILRIDIDRPDVGRGYSIPPDNPFVDLPGAAPEVYAYGFRNPWRMSFDAPTGDLWVGDVGWEAWEMVYRVRPGGNYGWPIKEGPSDVRPDAQPGPTPILPPDIALSHADAASVTGGVVYRGSRYPEIHGQYVFGDWITRRLWAAEFDAERVLGLREIAVGAAKPVSFELDHDGELLVLDYNSAGRSAIYRLEPNPATESSASFPRRLSETGLVASTNPLRPAAGVVPYQIAAPMFRDGATAEYWLAVPGEELPVFYGSPQTTFDWFRSGGLFPTGTVLVKTYWLATTAGDAETRRPIETQVAQSLGRADWSHYTFRWDDEGNDAELVDAGGEFRQLTVHDASAPGGQKDLNWAFAARSQCRTCHTPWRGEALGLTEAQLRGTLSPSGGTDRDAWHRLIAGGWVRPDTPREPVWHQDPQRLVDPHDQRQPLELRARSYLHANCAHCHLEGGNASVAIDVIHTKPLKDLGLLDVSPMRGDFQVDGAKLIAPGDPSRSVLLYRSAKLGSGRMPPIGTHGADHEGIALLTRWIEGLPSSRDSTDETISESLAVVVGTTEPESRDGAIRDLLANPRGALALAATVWTQRIDAEAQSAVLTAATAADPAIAELFEAWLPDSLRVERLGAGFDFERVLSLSGDAEAGRQLFLAGRGQCAQCHAIQTQGLEVGPDLSRIGVKYPKPAEMLKHLVDPSAEIAEAYRAVTVLTDEGQSFVGRVVDRDEKLVRLRDATGRLIEIEAERIEAERMNSQSLMPANLLDGLTARQAADLLAYLLSLR